MFLFLAMSSMQSAVPSDLQVLEVWKTHPSFGHLNLWGQYIQTRRRTLYTYWHCLKESYNLSEAQRLKNIFTALVCLFGCLRLHLSLCLPCLSDIVGTLMAMLQQQHAYFQSGRGTGCGRIASDVDDVANWILL